MGKSLYIAEKPSVAQEFAKTLNSSTVRKDGYLEGDSIIVTWCVGHLVTMSYPEVYDEKYKKWSMETLPFIPEEFKYEVIPSVAKQFHIVSGLLNRPDVDTIYVCTDSGREGEYIYRLVDQQAGCPNKAKKRVWIDSQTEEEILRGIREAKDLSEYDALASSAYLRAKEDYLMGINFSRVLTLKYGNTIAGFLNQRYAVVSVGRVMTCVLGMVVRREREIREFVKTPFYRVLQHLSVEGTPLDAEWKAVEGSAWYGSPKLYRDNGFLDRRDAEQMISRLSAVTPQEALVADVTRKQEKKNPPLLYNLAELQNDCSRRFKISPDETLRVVQELYEKKLVTYPRTDARVLSTAVVKEIHKNIGGLKGYTPVTGFAEEILSEGKYKGIAKTRYVDDKQITDHYAIIPTGQGLKALSSLKSLESGVYDLIVRRFLSIFYPPAVYRKYAVETVMDKEHFFVTTRTLEQEGYLKVLGKQQNGEDGKDGGEGTADAAVLSKLKKGQMLPVTGFTIKEGETSPPKRYNSGSMILAMENAGQLIEEEELREQIKGSGIGTSATRAEILKKLISIRYLNLNKKTQIITPTLNGEMVYDVVDQSIRSLLDPKLTASWEKGLSYVAEGTITGEEYMSKLDGFVRRRVEGVRTLANQSALQSRFRTIGQFYPAPSAASGYRSGSGTAKTTGKGKGTARKTDGKSTRKRTKNSPASAE